MRFVHQKDAFVSPPWNERGKDETGWGGTHCRSPGVKAMERQDTLRGVVLELESAGSIWMMGRGEAS